MSWRTKAVIVVLCMTLASVAMAWPWSRDAAGRPKNVVKETKPVKKEVQPETITVKGTNNNEVMATIYPTGVVLLGSNTTYEAVICYMANLIQQRDGSMAAMRDMYSKQTEMILGQVQKKDDMIRQTLQLINQAMSIWTTPPAENDNGKNAGK